MSFDPILSLVGTPQYLPSSAVQPVLVLHLGTYLVVVILRAEYSGLIVDSSDDREKRPAFVDITAVEPIKIIKKVSRKDYDKKNNVAHAMILAGFFRELESIMSYYVR